MSAEILLEIACPNCRTPISIGTNHESRIRCDACGSQFILAEHLCPQCGRYHEEERKICVQCGDPLVRTCPICKHSNWTGDEYCQHCHAVLDTLETLRQQVQSKNIEGQHQREAEIKRLNQLAEEASRKRMAEFEAIENERLARQNQKQGKKRRRELLIISFVGLALIGFVILALIWVLVTS